MKPLFLILAATIVVTAAAFTSNAQNANAFKYIVTLKDGVKPGDVAVRHGIVTEEVYTHALNGFAGVIPAPRLQALLNDNRVQNVERDFVVTLARPVVHKTSQLPLVQGEGLPVGIDRVDADLHSVTDASAVGVAVIDTGISLSHPELNVAGNISFVRRKRNGDDDHGHGSHCAGIIAAKINGAGVRGMAPNARLFSVKVLDSTGSGSLSIIISGVDWVTKYAASKNIKVANMSLGFQGSSSSLNSAIAKSVAAGVTYVVAAGNSAMDAAGFSPANHPDVLSVSAIVDTDGTPGGLGTGTGYGADDWLATFSNFGGVVDIAAPGVNVYSTYKNGGYATMSGTSMAAPHVAGGAALYIASNPAASPADVRAVLLGGGTPQDTPLSVDGTRTLGGFSGDSDGYAEPLLDALVF